MDTARRTRVVAVAAGLLLLLLVALGTAGGSLVPVHRAPAASLPTGGADGPEDRPSPSAAPPPSTLTTPAPEPVSGTAGSAAEDAVLLALLGVLVAVALVVLVLLLRRLDLRRRARPVVLEPGGPVIALPAVPAEPDGLTGRVALAAEAARTAASGAGSARLRLLACWVALEDAVAEAGLVRGPGETCAELTRRVVSGRLVDPEPLTLLHGLYERARYAPGEVDEDGPRAAATLLERIQADLSTAARS